MLGVPEAHITTIDMTMRLVAALLLGGLIGLERELKDRPSGLRTHMLTALASALFTIIAYEMFREISDITDGSGTTGDPIRVVQAVTGGVAFLAAGSIIRSKDGVKGLTTGAGMWTAGAIGVACGSGFFGMALVTAVLTVTVLFVLGWFEKRVMKPDDA